LFGARATGKTALLRAEFGGPDTLWLDLLDPRIEARLSEKPGEISELIEAHRGKLAWVVIDEVQKAPKLLDVVHQEIEACKIKFALTGSSARNLKKGGANLLAGRAIVNYLF